MVADSALYTAQNLKLLSEIKWLSRVPLSLAEAKKLVQSTPNSEFIKSQIEGYSYTVVGTYATVEQRWLVVESDARKKSDQRQLEKRFQKLEISAMAQLKKLQKEHFNCRQDAIEAVSKLSKQFKYHDIENIMIQYGSVKPQSHVN